MHNEITALRVPYWQLLGYCPLLNLSNGCLQVYERLGEFDV